MVDKVIPCVFLIDPNRSYKTPAPLMTGTLKPTPTAGPSLPSAPQQHQATIQLPPKIYQPQLPSTYIEPEFVPDALDGMELLYKDHGASLQKQKAPLPPRDPNNIIHFDPKLHQEELDSNLKWGDCPIKHRPKILALIKEYWDVFCQDGLQKHICGYQCRINTGNISPICCKVPQYGPHESKVITMLTQKLESNELVEDDNGPWGALVVLATKPNQKNVP